MTRMLGSAHYWNARYCNWRDSCYLQPWPKAVQVAFKRRHRRIEQRRWRSEEF